MHDDPTLPQHPFGDGRLTGGLVRVEAQSGDDQDSRGIAPDGELRALDDELLQTKLHQRERRPRDDELDLRQVEHRLPDGLRAAADPEAADHELRIPAVPSGRERRDLDLLPQLARQRRRQRVAIVVDARKHDETQRKQQQRKNRESGDEKGTRGAGDACHYRRVRIRGAKNGAHEGHNGNRASIVSERAGTPFH